MLHSLAGIQSFRSSTKVFLIPATPKRIVFALVTGLELAPGSLPDVEEVDTNDLMRACEDIITAYDAPARKARIEAKMAEAREALNRPELQKLLALYNLKK